MDPAPMSGLSQAWTALIDATPGGPFGLFVIGTTAAQGLSTLLGLGVFELAERRGWWQRYRYPDDKPPKPELRATARKEIALAHLGLPLVIALLWPLYNLPGLRVAAPLPSLLEVAWQLVFFMLVQDTIFYWGHRGLHRPWWFSKVHAQHHRYRGTRAEAFAYTHPVETTLNGLAMYAGPILVSTHVVTVWIWLIIRMLETIDAHSGYCLPLSPWAPRHCWHHRFVHGSFGSFFGLWDRLMGTDAGYREWARAQASE